MSVVRAGGSSRCMPVSRVDRLCRSEPQPWETSHGPGYDIRGIRYEQRDTCGGDCPGRAGSSAAFHCAPLPPAGPRGGRGGEGELEEGAGGAAKRSPGWPLRADLKERPRPGACRPASCRRCGRGLGTSAWRLTPASSAPPPGDRPFASTFSRVLAAKLRWPPWGRLSCFFVGPNSAAALPGWRRR
jgi:hypothetical protein